MLKNLPNLSSVKAVRVIAKLKTTMGYIKEPAGIDFVVDPTPLTMEDRKIISEVISYYKATGRKKFLPKSTVKTRLAKTKREKTFA